MQSFLPTIITKGPERRAPRYRHNSKQGQSGSPLTAARAAKGILRPPVPAAAGSPPLPDSIRRNLVADEIRPFGEITPGLGARRIAARGPIPVAIIGRCWRAANDHRIVVVIAGTRSIVAGGIAAVVAVDILSACCARNPQRRRGKRRREICLLQDSHDASFRTAEFRPAFFCSAELTIVAGCGS